VVRYAVPLVVLGGVLLQLTTVVQTRPYYFSYYNPLLGGAAKAPEVMMIGWGEGLDQAARYLNAKPGADQIIAQAWYEEIFPYIFDGKTIQKKLNDEPDDIQKADYYVLYIHQWQRQLPSQKTLQYFANLQPEYVVRINGIDYAKVYSRESLLAGAQDGGTPQAPPGTSP
jgi:hypothetical protein